MRKLLFLACCLMAAACNQSSSDAGMKKGTAKGASISAPYELLVVCNKEWLKTSQSAAFKEIVNAEIPCLPQIESQFRTTTVNPANFSKSFMFYANIITCDISKKHAEPACQVARDVYARPQTIVSLTAPDQASFDQLCRQHRDQILDLFNQAELKREANRLKRTYSGIAQAQAKKQFGCDIHAPAEINAIKVGKDFFWASSEGDHENYYNLCMYSYPYTSTHTFTLDYFLAKRDSFMQKNIEGTGERQYMSTDRRVVQSRNITLDNHYVQEVRGLWQMEHAPMGGPFVSYVQLDSARQRIIVTEGFVYAPGKDKRPFIRQLEACLQTLSMEP